MNTDTGISIAKMNAAIATLSNVGGIVKMMPNTIVIGRCRDCKHYILCDEFYPLRYDEDIDHKCEFGVFIGGIMLPEPPPGHFGCVMWEKDKDCVGE